MRFPSTALALAAILAAAPFARAAQDAPAGFFRCPSIGGGVIVFSSEGDIWRVPAAGGTAMRLTAHEGDESFPRLSPDGRLVAFTAAYEGNPDVYVVSVDGGEPERLTYHPAQDVPIGWTEDGKVLFRSRRETPNGDYRVYKKATSGGAPELVPLEPAAWLAFEPGGARIALQKIGLENHSWKRYRGGEAEEIEIGTLQPLAFAAVTDYDGKDAFPMWGKDGLIYFVTDRWGRPNLASMKPDGSDVRRLTTFDDYDVRWPALGDGKIVYEHAMDVWSLDLATGANAMVPIRLPSDRLQTREKFVDPEKNLAAWGISKDGERIVLESRGDLFVTRTRKKGLIRRLTESSLSRTRAPSFSPDGKSVAAWMEIDGEEQLVLHAADNGAAPRTLGTTPPGWHFTPAWSPDGKRLAWGDETFRIRVTDAATGKIAVVDSSTWEISRYTWSPDGRYLAYAVDHENLMSQIRVWDSGTGRVHSVTDPFFNSHSPAWDPKGKFLYLLSDRLFNPRRDRFDGRFVIDEATYPYVVSLRADEKLPFRALGDDEVAADDDDEKEKGDDKPAGKEKGKSKGKEEPLEPIRVDWDGIMERMVQVPVEPGNYYGMAAAEGKLHWLSSPNRGMQPPEGDDDEPSSGASLVTYDLEKEKLSTLATGVLSYDLSMDAQVLIYRTKEGFTRVAAGATSAPEKDDAKDAKVDLSGWSLSVDPRAEWKQMFREAWRLQRDFFYDPAMHGVDWRGVLAQYEPLADRIASRDDLNDLLGEMLGELSVGHAYRWGGDTRRGKSVGTGLLAADLDYDPGSGFWKIRKIYAGDYPDTKRSSPLTRPDLGVKAGMWLVAVDGRPLEKGEDFLRRFAGRAGEEVEISVGPAPRLDGAKRIVVKPVENDTPIRYATWIRENRAYVDSVSHGAIGYLHLYDMGGLGLSQFSRDYTPQWNKKGFIIDDRWNHGGFVAPMILAHLDRKLFSVGTSRHGGIYTSPDRCFHGHMVCLINRQGGSDCETLALGFKDFGLGPVIGTRTWGGWVGIRGDKAFRDGGITTQPEFSGWDPRGRGWQIEGHGVDPDVVLDLGPDGLIHGRDVQLDAAVADIMGRLAKDPKVLPSQPPIVPRPLVTAR